MLDKYTSIPPNINGLSSLTNNNKYKMTFVSNIKLAPAVIIKVPGSMLQSSKISQRFNQGTT